MADGNSSDVRKMDRYLADGPSKQAAFDNVGFQDDLGDALYLMPLV